MELTRQNGTDLASFPSASALAPSAPEEATLSLRGILEACFRHRTRFLTVLGLVLLATVATVLLTPRRYQASMQLVVLNARQYAVVSSDTVQPTPQSTPITDTEVNSQAELLRSHDVLGGALDQLGLADAPAAARDKAMDALAHHLDVAPVRQSDVLNVTYTDTTPEKAQATLQAIANSFVARELVLLRPTVGQKVFDDLVATQTARLGDAQARFAAFKIAHGIASLAQDETGLVQQVREAGTQADQLNSELAAERQRAAVAQQQLGVHPDRIVTQNKTVPNQQAIQELSAKLVDLQNKRTALLTGYLPSDRFVQEVDTQIATTRDTLETLRRNSAAEQTTDINPLHQELSADVARSSIATDALEAKHHAVDADRRSYLKKLNSLEQHGAEYEALEHEVSEAQQNLDTAVHKRDQAAVEDALDRDRILNVAFAARPSADSLPIQPKPKLYLALGFFVALFFAVGSCALAEMSRETVYTAAELDALTGLLTLAVVPLAPGSGLALDVPRVQETESKRTRTHEPDAAPHSAALEPYLARSVKG